MMTISIPKPCHEDWDKMSPNEQGRHCNACCKTVVDFTGMSDNEVKYFFLNKKKEESVCGRFKNDQLHRIKIELPYNIYKISMPLWKRFLTACLLAFSSMLFSCDALVGKTETLGETVPFVMADDTTAKRLIPPHPPAAGQIFYHEIDTSVELTCNTIKGDTIYVEGTTTGNISMEPIEPTIVPGEVLPATEEPKNSETILTGKVAFDTSKIIPPDTVDTAKPIRKENDCGNGFINL